MRCKIGPDRQDSLQVRTLTPASTLNVIQTRNISVTVNRNINPYGQWNVGPDKQDSLQVRTLTLNLMFLNVTITISITVTVTVTRKINPMGYVRSIPTDKAFFRLGP